MPCGNELTVLRRACSGKNKKKASNKPVSVLETTFSHAPFTPCLYKVTRVESNNDPKPVFVERISTEVAWVSPTLKLISADGFPRIEIPKNLKIEPKPLLSE